MNSVIKKKKKIKKEDYTVGNETETLPFSHRATGNRADPYTEPNSCLTEFNESYAPFRENSNDKDIFIS